MSGADRVENYMATAYRQKVVEGHSDEQVCNELALAMNDDSELALSATVIADRLGALIRVRPQQCFVSKMQLDFLTRALAKIKVG